MLWGLGGGGANYGEPIEGAGGTFGRITLFNRAMHQQLLDCNHSKAHKAYYFKTEWKGITMQSAVRNETQGRGGGGDYDFIQTLLKLRDS